MESALPPQPDFGLISQNYSVLSEQFSRLGNLPAVGGAVQFQRTLDQVLEQLRLLSEKVDGVDRRVAALKGSLDVG
ncbi:hypothetical protein E5D57_000037 [Metarhizium anisopliae]|nr:hypothetical protein E5D57_000022 [Metarhizium anisopliae]KAF5136266.1 hypothetical protein E5D57_000026 [Metarhizium anisopliae]KAF5136277.1 hypothetical protein E5D57_000037 [Metarhizium anisopliae]